MGAVPQEAARSRAVCPSRPEAQARPRTGLSGLPPPSAASSGFLVIFAQEKGGVGAQGDPTMPQTRILGQSPPGARGGPARRAACGAPGAGRSYGHLRAPALRAPRPRAAAPGGGTESAHPGKAERGTRGVRRGSPTGPLALRDRSRLGTFFPSGETSGRSTREAQRGRAPRMGESLGGYGVLSPGACGGAGARPSRRLGQ